MDTFKSIIDKISEGLNFFDFSFFVSGFVTYVTLLYFTNKFFHMTIDYTTVSGILASIVLSYVCGIISFSLGKWIRSWIRLRKCLKNKSFDELFKEGINWAIENRRKSNPNASFDDLLGCLVLHQNREMVYSAMWIEIRKLDEKDVYYRPLYRQWVMQAICEGLVFSFLLIFLLSIGILVYKWHFLPLYLCSSILALMAFVVCCREARRYAENQIKEVIISYYYLKNSES